MLKSLKQARTALSMLNPDEMRKRAARDLHIGLVARTDSGYERLENFLADHDRSRETRLGILGSAHRATDQQVPPQVDLVLYEPGLHPHPGAYVLHRDTPSETVHQILHDHDELALALAQRFPAFRRPVIDRAIQTVARENALFAVAAALPNIIPSFIELPWAFGEFASDTFFLTANQVRMAFLIAAACGCEVGFTHQKAAIGTIVAAAFGWRAIARELVGKIPLGGGLIPKGAIAYAGTFAVGKAIERAYANQPFTPEERRVVYDQAYQQGIEVARSLQKRA
jgi:uncharacterized protein (DUF697 family)